MDCKETRLYIALKALTYMLDSVVLSNANPAGISISFEMLSSEGGKDFLTTLLVVLSVMKGR